MTIMSRMSRPADVSYTPSATCPGHGAYICHNCSASETLVHRSEAEQHTCPATTPREARQAQANKDRALLQALGGSKATEGTIYRLPIVSLDDKIEIIAIAGGWNVNSMEAQGYRLTVKGHWLGLDDLVEADSVVFLFADVEAAIETLSTLLP